MNLIKIIFGFVLFPLALSAGNLSQNASSIAVDSIPPVFMIGEYEFEYEEMVKTCDKLLLEVCQDSMQLAYKHWLLMLHDMENYAESVDFDIKGIKIWLNIFWNDQGKINKLVYYPKPNSRNTDFSKLTEFFEEFLGNYDFPLEYTSCFSHYGSATFPTFAKLYLSNEP